VAGRDHLTAASARRVALVGPSFGGGR